MALRLQFMINIEAARVGAVERQHELIPVQLFDLRVGIHFSDVSTRVAVQILNYAQLLRAPASIGPPLGGNAQHTIVLCDFVEAV